MQESIRISSRKKFEVLDLTPQVASVVARARVSEGICTVFVRHATAAIVINENGDAGVRADIVAALDRLYPEGIWEHDEVDDNGAAHLKAVRPFLGQEAVAGEGLAHGRADDRVGGEVGGGHRRAVGLGRDRRVGAVLEDHGGGPPRREDRHLQLPVPVARVAHGVSDLDRRRSGVDRAPRRHDRLPRRTGRLLATPVAPPEGAGADRRFRSGPGAARSGGRRRGMSRLAYS
jgi:secondary thiamine-phosphate synthase enzyme